MKVYKYGLLAPTTNKNLVFDQMHKAHRYRNDLTEIANAEKAFIRQIEYEPIKNLKEAAIKAQLSVEECLSKIKKERSSSRSKVDKTFLKNEFKEAKLLQKEARANLFSALKDIRSAGLVKKQKEDIGALSLSLQKNARHYCGVYWGTYLLVEDAMKVSIKNSFKKDSIRFKGWNGEAAIGVQIQSGMDSKDIFKENSLIYIDSIDERAWNDTSRGLRRKLSRTKLHIRICSDDKKNPVWAEFPMIMHRPLPTDSRIKKATVRRRLFGLKEEWSLEITVDDEKSLKKTLGDGIVSIDLGWRKIADKIRVATTYDGEAHSFIQISTKKLDKADGLKGLRQDLLNSLKKEFNGMDKSLFPEWFIIGLKRLDRWKITNKRAGLVKRWKSNRKEGDTQVFNHFEKWRYSDQHLLNYEYGNRRAGLRERKDFYRKIASDFGKKYGKVILEDLDLSKMAEKPELSSDKDLSDTSRSQRFMAANSELRSALENVFGKENIIKINPAYTSRTCNACKTDQSLDPSSPIHTCTNPKCGLVWDRDENAAKNIRERGIDELNRLTARNDEKTSKNEQIKGGAWNQRKKDKAARLLLKETARKPDANYAEQLVS